MSTDDKAFYLNYYLTELAHCCAQCGAWIIRGYNNTYEREKRLLENCVVCKMQFGTWVGFNVSKMMIVKEGNNGKTILR